MALNIAHDSCSHTAERIIHRAESPDLKNTEREEDGTFLCPCVESQRRALEEKALKQTVSVPQKGRTQVIDNFESFSSVHVQPGAREYQAYNDLSELNNVIAARIHF